MRKAKKSTFLIGTFTFATSCLPIQENLIEVPSYTPPKIQKKIEVTGKLESCILQNIKTKTLLREGDIVLKILSEGVGFTVFEVTSIDTVVTSSTIPDGIIRALTEATYKFGLDSHDAVYFINHELERRGYTNKLNADTVRSYFLTLTANHVKRNRDEVWDSMSFTYAGEKMDLKLRQIHLVNELSSKGISLEKIAVDLKIPVKIAAACIGVYSAKAHKPLTALNYQLELVKA